MAFDRLNAAHLLALKNEVLNDPLTIGYGTTQSVETLLNLLNLPENNTSLVTGVARMTGVDLLNALFDIAVGASDQFRVQLLFEAYTSIDEDMSVFRPKVKSLSNQISNAIDLITRPLSRGEVLFGGLDEYGSAEYVRITQLDYITARDS